MSMNKYFTEDLKDILWGVFWVGMVIFPVLYSILHKKKETSFDATG